MDEQAVLLANFQRDLPNGLQEGLGLDIADGAADLRNHHVGVCLFAHAVHEFLDLIGDVRNDLHGRAEVFAPALLVQHVPVDLAGGQVGILVQIFVNETLIVSQIQIRFRAVLCDIHFAVLIGAHGSGVHIDIGIQLLSGDLQASRFQQAAKGGGGNALA